MGVNASTPATPLSSLPPPPSTLRPDPRVDAIEGMPPLLKGQYERIRDRMGHGAREDARMRYDVGRIIAEVRRSEGIYGKGAVLLLATALGRDHTTLYRWANVAEAWSPAELEALLAKRDRLGQSLVWSHLVEIAQAPEATRDRWIEWVLAEAATAHLLATALRHGIGRARAAAVNKRFAGAPAGMKRLAAHYERLVECPQRAKALDLEELEQLIEDQQEVVERLSWSLRMAKAARVSMGKPRQASPQRGTSAAHPRS